MKRIIFPLAVMLMFSCQKDAELASSGEANNATNYQNKNGTSMPDAFVENEVVIYYEDGTTEAEKEVIREENGVLEYRTCDCADENLELWIFDVSSEPDPTGFIETKVTTAQAAERIEDADYNALTKISDSSIDIPILNVPDPTNAMGIRVSSNTGVTVAVLDTGVDYAHFTYPLLYNNDANGCVVGEQIDLFGWNFVDDNNNPYDDFRGKHGTANTEFIASHLNLFETPFQILPVKVADRNGNVRYFDVLCGFKYAVNNPDVDVVNMSFGWYSGSAPYLLQEFVDKAAQQVLVVTSAGNDSSNNDVNPHYPSSLIHDNVLAVASAIVPVSGPLGMGEIEMSRFTNYGLESVDVAGAGEELAFSYNAVTYYLTGTSYAAAKASGHAARLHEEGMSGDDLFTLTIDESMYLDELYNIRYHKLIPVE